MNDLICDGLVFMRLNNRNHLEHHYRLGTGKDSNRSGHDVPCH